MASVKINFRMTEKERERMVRSMEFIGMENESEFIRDAIRRRMEQIERRKAKNVKR